MSDIQLVNREKHLKYKNENLTVNVHDNNGFDVERADTWKYSEIHIVTESKSETLIGRDKKYENGRTVKIKRENMQRWKYKRLPKNNFN